MQVFNFSGSQHLVQGDVILHPLKEMPKEAVLLKENTKVLQHSEVTGHHHQFTVDSDVDLYSVGRMVKEGINTITENLGKIISVNKPSYIFHGKLFDHVPYQSKTGDHNSFLVDPGLYLVDIVREYDYDYHQTSRVRD